MSANDGFDSQLRTLYKYRSLSGDYGRSEVTDILQNSRMFWQSPDAFNDPFDCAPTFYFGKSAQSREAYARRAIRRNMQGSSRRERRQKKREILGRGPRRNAEIVQDSFRGLMRESAVSCFSLISDSLLMWAHYADSHRGLCFQFQEQVRPSPFFAFEVSYQAERPSLNGAATADIETFRSAVLTKASIWEYEQERRMLAYRDAAGSRSFPSEALTGIIFGARISSDDRAFVESLLDKRPTPLKRYVTRLSDSSFSLEVVPLD